MLASNQYQIDGETYSIESVLAKYSKELSEASRNGCRHRVKVYFAPDIPLAEYDIALDAKLGPKEVFYLFVQCRWANDIVQTGP